MPSPAANELPVSIEVASDGLTVRLALRSDRVAKALDAPLIVAHLTEMGITPGARGEAEIQELCRPRKSGRNPPPVIVATGTPCGDDLPPSLELLDTLAQLPISKRYVKTGDLIARRVASRSGTDGIDVFGKPILRKKACDLPHIDASLTISADRNTCNAAIDGIVRVREDGPIKKICVLPCLLHAGDLCGAAGQTSHLQSPGEITIEGRVSAAMIEAGGAIHIGGDIENAMATCDGDFTAGALKVATLDVAGNCIAASILQSRIACGGELIVEDGNIAGGEIVAARGLRCKSLGAPPSGGSAIKTIVEIGIDYRLRQRLTVTLPELDAQIAKAHKIRKTVEPLLHSLQPLTPKQQLRVAELLAEADALEASATRERHQLRQDYEAAIARIRAEVQVAEIVYPGVTIRFPGAQATVRIALKGPSHISLQSKNNERPRITLTQGSMVIPLESSAVNEDWRIAAKQLAA